MECWGRARVGVLGERRCRRSWRWCARDPGAVVSSGGCLRGAVAWCLRLCLGIKPMLTIFLSFFLTSRHQILLQAQQLGLKDSSNSNSTSTKPSSSTGRAAKRRRTDPEPSNTHARKDSTSGGSGPGMSGPGFASTSGPGLANSTSGPGFASGSGPGIVSPRSANSPSGGHRTTTSSPAITPQEQPTITRQAMPVSSLISPTGHIYGQAQSKSGHNNQTQSQTQTQSQSQTQSAPSTTTLPTMPWPYPTVAVNTASPVLTPTESGAKHYNRAGEYNRGGGGNGTRDGAKGSPSLPGPGQMNNHNHDRPAYHSPYLQHAGTGRRK